MITAVPRAARACAAAPELFFAENSRDIRRARELCAGCPDRADCLAGALRRCEPWGVWGGQLLRAGRVVRPPRLRPPAPPVRVGTARALSETERRNLRAFNQRRAEEAAARTCELVRHALDLISPDSLAPALAEAALLRLEHDKASVPELAAIAKVSRHVMAGRLRRVAGRAA